MILVQRENGVQCCAVDVLLDRTVDLAEAILDIDSELRQHKGDLAALTRLISSEGKRLHRVPPPPALLGWAGAYSADPQLAIVDWTSAYQALISGNEELG